MSQLETRPKRKILTPFRLWLAALLILFALGVCLLVLGLTLPPFAALPALAA